jgi:glycosyltransferase involved in cell wall biosynthesis
MKSHVKESIAPVYLIPVYKPTAGLLDIVRILSSSLQFHSGVIINDGSGKHAGYIFRKLAELPKVRVLSHSHNRGKGAALKTGIEYVSNYLSQTTAIVTADADGQHAIEDILKISQACIKHPDSLILGSRRFDGGIPFRSRVGNQATARLIYWLTGHRLRDTQTGLRGLPKGSFGWMLKISSNGYNFEMDVLLSFLTRNLPIKEVNIETIYLDHNQSSHFNPLLDSLRIYAVIGRYFIRWLSGVGRFERRLHS